MIKIILTNPTTCIIIIPMKTFKGGIAMRTLQLHDLIPHRGNLTSYFEGLLLDGAIAVQFSDGRRLEMWDYHDVYDYVDIVEEALDEIVYYLDLEDAILMAEQSKNCDPENRPLKDHLISIIEYYMDLYDYVIIHNGEWEILLHGYLNRWQEQAILRRAGLR
jgi:hypothetical protein